MATGSLMLAWRVKFLLDALMRAQLSAETHFRSIAEFLAGRQTELPTPVGFNQHVARTQKIGVWPSVLGLVMIGASGLLNACLLWAGF
jgi:hypothetical protein